MGITKKRLAEMTALMMVGDGVLTAVDPERHVGLWSGGPRWYRKAAEGLIRHPKTTRALGATAAVAGLWWAARQQPERRRRFLLF